MSGYADANVIYNCRGQYVLLKKAGERIDPDKLWINFDCGLKMNCCHAC